jgi:hypothetical protein
MSLISSISGLDHERSSLFYKWPADLYSTSEIVNSAREGAKDLQTTIVTSRVQLKDDDDEIDTAGENNERHDIDRGMPKVNRALIVSARKTYSIVEHYPYPNLDHGDDVIISNCAVGLNPIDWKSVDFNFCLPEYPWITGREMSGVVDAVGANVKECKVGDRVWTSQSPTLLPQMQLYLISSFQAHTTETEEQVASNTMSPCQNIQSLESQTT